MSPEFLTLLGVILIPIVLGVWLHRNIERVVFHLVVGSSDQAEKIRLLNRMKSDYRAVNQSLQKLDYELTERRGNATRLAQRLERLEEQKIRAADPLQNFVYEIGVVQYPGVGLLVEAVGPATMPPFSLRGSRAAENENRSCWVLAWGTDLLEAETIIKRAFAQRATVRRVITKYEGQVSSANKETVGSLVQS